MLTQLPSVRVDDNTATVRPAPEATSTDAHTSSVHADAMDTSSYELTVQTMVSLLSAASSLSHILDKQDAHELRQAIRLMVGRERLEQLAHIIGQLIE